MTDHFDRTEKFTDAEFDALARNSDGDVIDDLGMAYIWMNEAQVERLTGDDYTRVDEYREEMRYMMAEFS